MGPSIFIEQLSLQYGNDTILDNLNLTLEGGHIHLFVGPNGGGKTSLLKSILGLTPFQGEIQIHGEYRIGYVPQKAQFEYSLPLSVMDFMLLSQSRQPLFLGSHRRAREKAMVQLERLGMASRAERRMGQLSGGEQQRVLFAQALLDAPNLLVLDEPTTGMDKQGIEIIDQLLDEQLQHGVTLLAVHHDPVAISKLPNPKIHLINRRYQQELHLEQLQQMQFVHHSQEA